MLHRVTVFFIASWMLVACTHAADPWHESGHTFVQGRVYLDSPQAGATVEVMGTDARRGVTLPLAQTMTDTHGDWQVDVGAYEGPVQVTARGAQISQRLDALIPWVSPGESITTVSVTPITHIIAAYGRYFMRTGNAPDVAFSKATAQINALLGGISHQSVVPQPWPEAGAEPQPVVMNDAVSSTLYISAMAELAQRMSHENNVQPKTVITLETLAEALAEDIEADGNFDGLGVGGRRVKLRNTPLTKDTIRTDLALALRRFSESRVHNTVLRWPEIQTLAYAVSTAEGPMFNQVARPLQLNGPTLMGCEVNSEHGEKRPVTWPQKGLFSVVCQWEDAVGVAESSVSATAAAERLVPDSSYYNSRTVFFALDSRGFAGDVYTVMLRAVNNEGSASEELLALTIDNELPRLELRKPAVWTSGKQSAAIVVCADKALRKVSSSIPESRQEQDGLCISLIYDTLPCGGAYPMSIRAEDLAGNVEDINAFLGCEAEAPAIIPTQSLFRNDLDDQMVDLGAIGWDSSRAEIKKFYNMFDLIDQSKNSNSQNLPMVKFRVSLPTSYSDNVPKQSFEVSYRYIYQGIDHFEGEWRPLQSSTAGQFELPLSYQTLLPPQYDDHLITAARLNNFVARSRYNDAHRIEFRVVDEMGNEQVKAFSFTLNLKSPPIYLSNCAISRSLRDTRYKNLDRFDLKNGPFLTPKISWEVPRPSNSMAPDPIMEIVLSPLASGHFGASRAHAWVYPSPSDKLSTSIIPQAKTCLESKRKLCPTSIFYVDGRCTCAPKVTEDFYQADIPLGRLHLESASVEILGSGQGVDVPIRGTMQKDLAFSQSKKTPQGHLEWVFSETLGIVLGQSPLRVAKEIVTVPTIWLQYPGLMAKPAKSQNGLPPPHQIVRDDSCRAPWGQGGILEWNSDAE